MLGAYDREVTSVDSRDVSDAQPFSRGDDRSIHRAKWHVAIARNQFGDPKPVRGYHRFDGECPDGEVAEESDFGFGPETGREQVDDLGDHQRRNDEWAGMRFEQFEGGSVVRVVGVDVGVERSGVDDDRGYRATSAARISSMRSDTSLRPLCPEPAAPSRRRVDGPPR
jgi:hypothetical protein